MVTIPARQARAFRVIDNRTSELTSWDTDLLPDALSGLNDLDIFSFDDVLPLAVTAGKTDPDDIPETPKNPVSRVGDIWTLGKHRLMCGDATKPEHVERLLDGAKPDLMVTDPPYGVQRPVGSGVLEGAVAVREWQRAGWPTGYRDDGTALPFRCLPRAPDGRTGALSGKSQIAPLSWRHAAALSGPRVCVPGSGWPEAPAGVRGSWGVLARFLGV